jgi:hypothetical protein
MRERERERIYKGERERNRLGMPCWLCYMGFSWLLGAIKDLFKGQSLNFMCTLCGGSYYFG